MVTNRNQNTQVYCFDSNIFSLDENENENGYLPFNFARVLQLQKLSVENKLDLALPGSEQQMETKTQQGLVDPYNKAIQWPPIPSEMDDHPTIYSLISDGLYYTTLYQQRTNMRLHFTIYI